MKLIPLILSFTLLLSGLGPWGGGAICQESSHLEEEACHADEKETHCCKPSMTDKHNPSEEDPCRAGCQCYCCVSIIVASLSKPPFSHQQKNTQLDRWEINLYSHDFTHLIWHPPQLG